MTYLWAFIIGAAICGIASLVKSIFKLTIGMVTVLFVIIGAFLSIYGIYDKLIELSGAGALLPITSFGNSLANASYQGLIKDGFIGLFKNIYTTTGLGIAFALICGFIIAIIFKPND